MLVNTKAKVGVFSIALGAYLPQFPSLVPEFEAQYEAFKKTIPDTVEIIDGGMVTTKEQSMVAGDKFRAADVDLVFLQMLTYATSYNMLPAIRDLNVPVVLVNVQKLKALDYDHTDIATWLGEGMHAVLLEKPLLTLRELERDMLLSQVLSKAEIQAFRLRLKTGAKLLR